jgi:hypothetical protein
LSGFAFAAEALIYAFLARQVSYSQITRNIPLMGPKGPVIDRFGVGCPWLMILEFSTSQTPHRYVESSGSSWLAPTASFKRINQFLRQFLMETLDFASFSIYERYCCNN